MLPGLLMLVTLAPQTLSAIMDTEGVPLAAAFSNSFVPKLFQALFPGRENLVFAPFGLSASLAMIMETLDTKAAEEARRVLRIRPEDKNLLRTGFKNILLECEVLPARAFPTTWNALKRDHYHRQKTSENRFAR